MTIYKYDNNNIPFLDEKLNTNLTKHLQQYKSKNTDIDNNIYGFTNDKLNALIYIDPVLNNGVEFNQDKFSNVSYYQIFYISGHNGDHALITSEHLFEFVKSVSDNNTPIMKFIICSGNHTLTLPDVTKTDEYDIVQFTDEHKVDDNFTLPNTSKLNYIVITIRNKQEDAVITAQDAIEEQATTQTTEDAIEEQTTEETDALDAIEEQATTQTTKDAIEEQTTEETDALDALEEQAETVAQEEAKQGEINEQIETLKIQISELNKEESLTNAQTAELTQAQTELKNLQKKLKEAKEDTKDAVEAEEETKDLNKSNYIDVEKKVDAYENNLNAETIQQKNEQIVNERQENVNKELNGIIPKENTRNLTNKFEKNGKKGGKRRTKKNKGKKVRK